MKCPPLGPVANNNPNWQISSSISPRKAHPGDKIVYVVTVHRARSSGGPGGNFVISTGSPIGFYCTASVACTINGAVAPSAGPGAWGIPSTVSAAFGNYNDPATSWTFRAVFTLDEATTTCNGQAGYAGASFTGEEWPISITGGAARSFGEDDRNRRDSRNKLLYGDAGISGFLCEQESSGMGSMPMSYNSANFTFPPASLGWGWTLQYNKVVEVDSANDDIVFYDGSGSFERWKKLPNNSYVARYADNYATLAINGSNQVVITTKDKRVLTFRASDGKIHTEVDRNGNTTTYDYDTTAPYHLKSVEDGEGRFVYLNYGTRTDGQPVSMRRQNETTGRQTSFEYHTNGRLCKVTSPTGEVNRFEYDANNRLYQHFDPRGKLVVEYDYDSQGRVETETRYGELRLNYSYAEDLEAKTRTTTVVEEDLTLNPDPQPRTTVFTFDDFAQLIKKVDPVGNVWQFEYNDLASRYLLTEQVDPNGHVTSYDFDSKGNLITAVDAQGNTTSMTYTDGYLLASIQRPPVKVNNVLTTYSPTVLSYTTNGNLWKITDSLDSTPVITEFTPGTDGRVLSITDREGKVTEFEYTARSSTPQRNKGNLAKVKLPAGPNSAPQREILFEYNEYDERTKVTDAGGNKVDFQYYDDGRLKKVVDGLDKELSYEYLAGGLLRYLDLPANQASTGVRRTEFFHDEPGRVKEVNSQIGSSSYQTRVKYDFDGRSNLKKLIRLKRDLSNNVVEKAHEFSFDNLNRQTQALDPLGHLSAVEYDPYCKNFTTKSARGVQIEYSRDSLCRLTEMATPGETRELHYDELSRLIKVVQTHNPLAKYENINSLPTDRPPTRFGLARYGNSTPVVETTEYLYDELDRLVKITFPDSKVVLYEYDLEGRVTKVTDMLSNVTEYSYYNDGRLYQVTAKNTGGNQVFTYTYDLAGRMKEIQYPTSTGVVARFYDVSNNSGWDANGRLKLVRYTKGSSPEVLVQSFAYTYDDSGNRTSMVETPASGPAVTWAYYYDWLDRLIRVDKDTFQQTAYSYDESDNRIQLQMGSDTHAYKYDFADRITSRLLNSSTVETFSHDDDGNMIARTSGGVTTTYSWDSFDKLTSIMKSSFSESYRYDHEGIRKSKGSNTCYFSSGAASLADLKTTNSTSFIQGDQIRGMRQGSSYFWYILDALGTVRLVLDSSGNVAGSYASDEFGQQTSVSGSVEKPHTYTGGLGVRNEWGSDSKLLYARQRWYDPQLGRWLSKDPIGFVGGLHHYSYVRNGPANFVDPEGLIQRALNSIEIGQFRASAEVIRTVFGMDLEARRALWMLDNNMVSIDTEILGAQTSINGMKFNPLTLMQPDYKNPVVNELATDYFFAGLLAHELVHYDMLMHKEPCTTEQHDELYRIGIKKLSDYKKLNNRSLPQAQVRAIDIAVKRLNGSRNQWIQLGRPR